jgi:hypothetical protein
MMEAMRAVMIVMGKLLESDVATREHRCIQLYSAAACISFFTLS